ncbi:MAG TPA: glycosyltransferase family 4 protein [Gemmatimonadaceae bacterium]|jgi:glycosyltransferase involved in cell wall biosynthesis|nr:glycosyltransferase family 4 protein [Gemmatimonadaceae bacterium]
MKILFLAPHPFFQHRGTPIADRAVLEVLSARGDTVDVLCFPEGEPVEITGCAIHRVGAIPAMGGVRPGFSLKKLAYDVEMLPHCVGMMRRGGYDLVHAVEESGFIALATKKLFGVPYVYDMDSSLAQQLTEKYPSLGSARRVLERFEARLVRESLAVVAVCKALQDVAAGYAPDKVIHRVEDFSLLPDRNVAGDQSVRSEPDTELESLSSSGRVILYVGNLERYQGIDLLVDAFHLIAPRAPDTRLVVVGGHPTDVQRYRTQVQGSGLADRIRFVGPRPLAALPHVLRHATIVASPRLSGQNTPMKVYSYLDSDRPLIATRLPTHTQVLDSEIALLVDPTPESMADGLARLLEDSALRTRLVRAATHRVRSEFSRDAYRRKMMTFYDAVERQLQLSRRRGALAA